MLNIHIKTKLRIVENKISFLSSPLKDINVYFINIAIKAKSITNTGIPSFEVNEKKKQESYLF
jgi:hypothetical protein